MTVPLWAWGATLAVICVLIAADLLLSRGADRGLRTAAAMNQARRLTSYFAARALPARN